MVTQLKWQVAILALGFCPEMFSCPGAAMGKTDGRGGRVDVGFSQVRKSREGGAKDWKLFARERLQGAVVMHIQELPR